MAELLIKAVDHVHPDPEIDEQGAYKKGDIVVVLEDDNPWGTGEGPPKFVIVKVPGITRASVESYRDSWQQTIGYEIVATDPVLDGARVRVFTEVPGAANEYGLTQAKVQAWLDKWNATFVSAATNEVRFDLTVEDAYTSEGFWDIDPVTLGVVIAETNYDQGTGVHTATIDVSGAANVTTQTAQIKVEEANGTVTDITGDILTVEFYRADVRAHFIAALQNALRKVVRRRRFRFSDADVDAALSAGGTITVTPAQATAKLIDKAV